MSASVSDDERCRALTESGERCSRPARDNGFCYQHDSEGETIEEANSNNEAGADEADETDAGETTENGDQEITMSSTESDIDETDIGQVREKVQSIADDIVGHPLDGITSIDRTDEGWRVAVEVVERKGVPDTQDILGRYEIMLDDELTVTGYQRTHRYRRDDMDHDI